MKGMEAILCGRPQSIVHNSVPLAVLSWHLFPDLIVLGNEIKHVEFKDPLVPESGKCTIGAVSRDVEENCTGMQWSLALSHYCFYGDPVKATSKSEFSSVNMDELKVIALGALLRTWCVGRVDFAEGLKISHWFRRIGHLLSRHQRFLDRGTVEGTFPWLPYIIKGAMFVIASENDKFEQDKIVHLIRYGQRRTPTLLVAEKSLNRPFFGLRNPVVAVSLIGHSDSEHRICYFRELAKNRRKHANQCLIVCQGKFFAQLITAMPVEVLTQKRSADRTQIFQDSHCRWLINQGFHYKAFDAPMYDATKSRAFLETTKQLGELGNLASMTEFEFSFLQSTPSEMTSFVWRKPPSNL